MRRLRQALVALTLSGVLVGGGTALAHAATSKSPTPSSTSSSSTAKTHSGMHSGSCPNM
jgi:hypothetical protein